MNEDSKQIIYVYLWWIGAFLVAFHLGYLFFGQEGRAPLSKWVLLIPLAIDLLSMFFLVTGSSGLMGCSCLVWLIIVAHPVPQVVTFETGAHPYFIRLFEVLMLYCLHMSLNGIIPLLVNKNAHDSIVWPRGHRE